MSAVCRGCGKEVAGAHNCPGPFASKPVDSYEQQEDAAALARKTPQEPQHDFGWALMQLRQGFKLERAGWNGKGAWIALQKGYPEGIPINKNTAEATGIPQGTVCSFLPYIMFRTASPLTTFVPWVASQTDILAVDWRLAK